MPCLGLMQFVYRVSIRQQIECEHMLTLPQAHHGSEAPQAHHAALDAISLQDRWVGCDACDQAFVGWRCYWRTDCH